MPGDEEGGDLPGLVPSPAPEGRPLNSLGWQPQVWANPIRQVPKGRPTAEVSAGPSGLGEWSACQPGVATHPLIHKLSWTRETRSAFLFRRDGTSGEEII
jgi:hypothetical protein